MKFLSDILARAGLVVDGTVTLNSVANATTDTDRFIVVDSGVVKYRTGTQLLSDIGAQAALTNPVTGTGAAGQVAYWNGTTSQSGSNNLFWDITNSRLGIGTTTPAYPLDVVGIGRFSSSVYAVGADFGGTVSVSGADYFHVDNDPTLNATANNQVIALLRLRHRGSNGAFSGVVRPLFISENGGGGQHFVQLFEGGLRIGPYSGGASAIVAPTAVFEGRGTDGSINLLDLKTNGGSTVILANSAGNIGVGTTTPSYKLHVVGSFGAVTSGVTLEYNSGILYHGASYYQFPSGSYYYLYGRAGMGLIFGSNNAEVGRFDLSGNLGIGTISPATKLHVSGGLQVGDSTVGQLSLRLTRTHATVPADAHYYVTAQNTPVQSWIEGGFMTGERAGTVTASNTGYPYYEEYAGQGSGTAKTFGFINVNTGNFTSANILSALVLKRTGQVALSQYTSSSSFTGTAAGLLAFDSSGNLITLANNTYLTGNQTITLSGDATGSGATAITVTLANSGVAAATYGSASAVPVITVDAKGRVTGVTTASISGSLTFTGDVTGSGTTGTTTTLTLANSGVAAGTYNNVTVNAKGLVTSGSNVSYLTSYTETDTLASVTGRGASTSTRTTFVEVGVTRNGADTVADGPWFRWTNADTSRQMLTQLNASNGLTTWAYNGATWSTVFILSQAGAGIFSSSVTATSFIRSGGTSSQFLKADGSVDSTTYQSTSQKGQANGYASLDGAGKVPIAQLPSSIMEYKGTWNASTNSPSLADGTGDTGDVYRVSTAGTRNLGSGSITFDVGDYVIYNGTVWEKSDTTDAVASVNGLTGVITLTTTNIAEGTNLYYTDARARAALSFAAGSGAYNSSTGVITIPTNTNQLTNGAGFITSYTETDTLATVTGRGASTSTAVTFNNVLRAVAPANTFEFALKLTKGNYADTGGHTTLIGFGCENSGWSRSAIGHTRTTSYDAGYLGFYVSNNTSNGNELVAADLKMMINRDGNIGMGTASPTRKLDVNGTSIFRDFTTVVSSNGNPVSNITWLSTDSGIMNIYTGGSAAVQLNSNGVSYFNGGNVGIGTSAPTYILDVAQVIRSKYGSNEGGLYLGGTPAGVAYVAGGVKAAPSPSYSYTGKLSFYTTTWGVGSDYGITEQMYIETSAADTKASTIVMLPWGGNVGLGTTTPSSILDARVSSGATSGFRFKGWSDASTPYLLSLGTQTYQDIFQIKSVNGLVTMGIVGAVGSNPDLVIQTNSTERIRITSAGSTGIGTASPGTAKLYVRGQGTGGFNTIFEDNTSPYCWLQIKASGGGSNSSWQLGSYNNGFNFYNDNNGAYRVFFGDNGNVGIGTTSPNAKLHIFDSTTAATVLVRGIDANLASSYTLQHGGGGARTQFDGTWYMSYGSAETDFGLSPNLGGGLVFWWQSGATTVNPMTLKRSGNVVFSNSVGIGTASPGYPLHVVGNTFSTGVISNTFWTDDSIRKLSAGAAMNFRNSAGTIEMILNGSGNLGVGVSNPTTGDRVEVGGTIRVHTGNNWDAIQIYTDGANGYIQGLGDETGLRIRSQYGNVMLTDDRGAVLIGATAQEYGEKLRVNGGVTTYHTYTQSSTLVRVGTVSQLITTTAGGAGYYGGLTYTAFTGAHDNTFNGSVTIPNSVNAGGINSTASIRFGAANATVTMTQSGSFRSYDGVSSAIAPSATATGGSISHVSAFHALAPYYVGSNTPTITNYFGLLLNDSAEYSTYVAITNRWGIYQHGSGDNNYFAGKVMVGTTTVPTQLMYVNGTSYFNGNMTVNGTITELSTINIKTNVETLDGALDKVEKMRGVSYSRKDNHKKEIGFIAEEVDEVYPEFVEYDEQGNPVGLHYARLTAVLLQSVKELSSRIKELEKRN